MISSKSANLCFPPDFSNQTVVSPESLESSNRVVHGRVPDFFNTAFGGSSFTFTGIGDFHIAFHFTKSGALNYSENIIRSFSIFVVKLAIRRFSRRAESDHVKLIGTACKLSLRGHRHSENLVAWAVVIKFSTSNLVVVACINVDNYKNDNDQFKPV